MARKVLLGCLKYLLLAVAAICATESDAHSFPPRLLARGRDGIRSAFEVHVKLPYGRCCLSAARLLHRATGLDFH